MSLLFRCRTGGYISPELVLRPSSGTTSGELEVTIRMHPHLVVERRFDRALIVLTGELDLAESQDIESLAVSLFSELTATVDVELSGVTFMGSRALSALLFLRTEVARHSGAEMRIVGCSEPVRRIFELTGVLDLLTLGPAFAEPSLVIREVA